MKKEKNKREIKKKETPHKREEEGSLFLLFKGGIFSLALVFI